MASATASSSRSNDDTMSVYMVEEERQKNRCRPAATLRADGGRGRAQEFGDSPRTLPSLRLLSILYGRSASALRPFARYAILANVKSLGLFLILLGSLGCGKSLEKQVQEQIRTFDHASLSEQQVEVQNVKEIGDHAVAEVRITTAVRLVKKDGDWVIEEFRIGDRRWERAEHILAVINEQRTETTLQQLNLITEGIRRYADLNQQLPKASSFEELMDILSPQFHNQVVRIDAWSNPFSYQAIGADGYDLKSAGPDGDLGTPDDLFPDP